LFECNFILLFRPQIRQTLLPLAESHGELASRFWARCQEEQAERLKKTQRYLVDSGITAFFDLPDKKSSEEQNAQKLVDGSGNVDTDFQNEKGQSSSIDGSEFNENLLDRNSFLNKV
jgi:hypothetical protein